MEQFLLDNAARYTKLVGAFKPKAANSKLEPAAPNPDMVVSARIRPLLEDEAAQGFPECLFPRPAAPHTVDVHELRQPVRGLPTLNSNTYTVDHLFSPSSS